MSHLRPIGKRPNAFTFALLLVAACSFPDRTFEPGNGGNAGSDAGNMGAGGVTTHAGGSTGTTDAGAGGSPMADSGGTANAGGSSNLGDGGSPDANGGTPGANGGAPNTNGGSPGANGGLANTNGGSPGAGGNANRGGTANAGGTPNAGGSTNTGGVLDAAGTTSFGGTTSGGSVGTSIPISIGYSQFHDSASGPENASGSLLDATFVKPAGTAEGDFMLVFLGCDHHLDIEQPRIQAMGWTLIDALDDKGDDEQGMYLMYHFATATEPSTTVFRDINYAQYTNGVQGLMAVYRGVDPAAPVNAYNSTFDAYTVDTQNAVTTATPAITTTVNNCLAIAGLSPDSHIDAPIITSWPAGFVDNRISVNNPAHPYPYGWANIYSAERSLPTAGLVPASAFEWKQVDKTTYFGGITFVLALAPRH